jgi:hypothetical protein
VGGLLSGPAATGAAAAVGPAVSTGAVAGIGAGLAVTVVAAAAIAADVRVATAIAATGADNVFTGVGLMLHSSIYYVKLVVAVFLLILN